MLGRFSRPLVCISIPVFLFACNSGGSSSGTTNIPEIPPVGLEIIAGTTPAPGAGSVSVNASVTVQFAVAMDPASLDASSLAVFQGGNQYPGSVVADAFSATFTPQGGFASDVPLRAVLFPGVRTASGQKLNQEYTWAFSTQDVIPIQVISQSPFPGQGSVPLVTKIVAQFSEPVGPGSVSAAHFQVVGPAGSVAGALSLVTSTSVAFVPSAPLLEYKDYTVTISGITDIAGNSVKPAFSWTFRTLDLGPPSIVSTNPMATNPMAIDIPVDVVVSVKFSEPMDPFSVFPSTLQLVDALGNAVSGVVALDPLDPSSVTLTPNLPLKDGRVFTATLDGAITDLAGNPIGPDFSWSFKTIAFQHGSFDLVETDDLGDANTPFVAVNPSTGEALAVWRQQIGSTSSKFAIYGSHFDPVKLAWSTPTCFENSFVFDAFEPSVAWSSVTGDAMAVWVQRINADPVPRVQAIPFYGSGVNAWDTSFIQSVSSPTATASNPRIASDAATGQFTIVWQENEPAGPVTRQIVTAEIDPYFYTLFPGGVLDASPTGAVSYYRDLGFALDPSSGNGFAVWAEQDAGGGAFNLYAMARSPLGWASASVLLESDLNVGNNNQNLDSPMVMVDPLTQDGLFVWRQKLGNTTGPKAYRLFYQRLRYAALGSVYSYPGCANQAAPCMIQLDKDSTNAVATPRIAVDSLGNALAIWAQSVPASSSTMPGDGLGSIYSVAFAPGSSVAGPIQFAENQTSVACGSPTVTVFDDAQGIFSLVFVEASTTLWSPLRKNDYSVGTGWGTTLLTLEPPPGAGIASISATPSLASNGAGMGLCVWNRQVAGGVDSIVSNRFP